MIGRSYLAQCEQEQLHLSGAIQPHGTLIAVDSTGKVSHAAVNVAEYLGIAAELLIGQALPDTFLKYTEQLPAAPGSRCFFDACVEAKMGLLDLVINRGQHGDILLELTPVGNTHALGRVIALKSSTIVITTEEELALARHRLLQEISDMTGAQRVMYYNFYEQGDGEVIDEVRDGEVFGSYLGLRFPASDIPQIARALYLKNPWRLIPDARLEPVHVLGLSANPPDLTCSDLRSVSPVHRVYLANMGVVGALSVPVIIAAEMTALITIHHYEPLNLLRALIEQIADRVRSFNLALAAYSAQCRMRMIDNLQRRFIAVHEAIARSGGWLAAWPEIGPLLRSEFRADGVAWCRGNEYACAGSGFEPPAFEVFDDWFIRQQNHLVWMGDSLSRQIPGFPLSEIAGVLAIKVFGVSGQCLRLYLTRCEHIHDVAWGGNPDKPIEHHDGMLGIMPRRSFETWVEKRLGYSRPWERESRLLGLKLRELIIPEMRV